MVSHHLAKFVRHRHCGGRDVMFLVLKSKIPYAPLHSPLLFISKVRGMDAHGMSY